MSLGGYSEDKLWLILVETVHAAVMYPAHKSYTREEILRENPDITPAELAARMNMPLGEAVVILHELAEERKSKA